MSQVIRNSSAKPLCTGMDCNGPLWLEIASEAACSGSKRWHPVDGCGPRQTGRISLRSRRPQVQILSARHLSARHCQPDTQKQGLNCCDRLTHRSQNTTLGPFWDHSLAEPELASVRKRTAKPFTRVAGLAPRAGVYATKRLFRPERSGRRAVATYPAPTAAPRLIGPRWAGQPRISTG